MTGPDGKPVPNVVECLITIANLSGGLGRYYGVARQASVYYPYSDLDRLSYNNGLAVFDRGICALPPLTTDDGISITGARGIVSSCEIFGTLAVAAGGVANKSLMKETSLTDATLEAITYTPGSNITYLAPIIIGAANAPTRLAVCKDGGVVEVLSDLVTGGPTSFGSMHANTNPCWGILSSPLNTATPGTPLLLIYANGNIYTLDGSQAIGTAPTVATGSVPNGGYPVGLVKLPGFETRAFWFFPREDLGAKSIYDGSQSTSYVRGYLVSTDVTGAGLQIVDLPIRPMWAAKIDGETIWVSDGTLVFEVSDKVRNLHWADQRQRSANYTLRAYGAFAIDGVGHLIVSQEDFNARASQTIIHGVERYVPATNSWHPVTLQIQSGSGIGAAWPSGSDFNFSAQYFLGNAGAAPFSTLTRNLHRQYYASGTAGTLRTWVEPDGLAPFYMNNDTGDVGGAPGITFDNNGNVYITAGSPAMLIEGYEGKPFVLESIACLGDLEGNRNTTVHAKVQVTVASNDVNGWHANQNLTFGALAPAGIQATFSGGDRYESHFVRYADNTDVATRFQYQVGILRSPDKSLTTPNALPLQFKLLIFTDGKPRSPREVRGY